MHAENVDPDRQNPEIEYDPDRADEINKKDTLVAGASARPEHKPDGQEVIRRSSN